MKKLNFKHADVAIMALVLFAVLYVLLYLLVPYSLKSIESDGLYLNTPDYFRDVNNNPWPWWHLALNYCSQFFYYKAVGPAILAFGITLLWTLLALVLKRRKIQIGIAVLFVGICLVWTLQSGTRQNEKWAHLEYAAENHLWDDVLDIATPQMTNQDRKMLPYALLALAVKGELCAEMLNYPIQGAQDFDSQGQTDGQYFFFKMVLYDCLGCPNEAIHNNFQAAVYLPYGTSFGTLRRLVRFNRDAGNVAMEDKYLDILSHSTLHATWQSSHTVYADTLRLNKSGKEPLITRSLGYNIGLMLAEGYSTPELCNYFLCQLLASRNLKAFVLMLDKMRDKLPDPLPQLYQDALVLYQSSNPSFDLSKYNLSAKTLTTFQEYQRSHAPMPQRYWTFYEKVPQMPEINENKP